MSDIQDRDHAALEAQFKAMTDRADVHSKLAMINLREELTAEINRALRLQADPTLPTDDKYWEAYAKGIEWVRDVWMKSKAEVKP